MFTIIIYLIGHILLAFFKYIILAVIVEIVKFVGLQFFLLTVPLAKYLPITFILIFASGVSYAFIFLLCSAAIHFVSFFTIILLKSTYRYIDADKDDLYSMTLIIDEIKSIFVGKKIRNKIISLINDDQIFYGLKERESKKPIYKILKDISIAIIRYDLKSLNITISPQVDMSYYNYSSKM